MNGRRIRQHGTTLVELTIAMAISATVFTAVLPLFVGIRNSTEARWAGLEMVQNARVLHEHLCRHLAEARRVVGVSEAISDRGYIAFETAGGNLYRCGLGNGGDIEFGPADVKEGRAGAARVETPVGILAGPVEYLRFTCYDGNDLAHPVTTANRIRLVTWEAAWRSPSRLTRGRITGGSCYLRAEARAGGRPTTSVSDDAAPPQEKTASPSSGGGIVPPREGAL